MKKVHIGNIEMRRRVRKLIKEKELTPDQISDIVELHLWKETGKILKGAKPWSDWQGYARSNEMDSPKVIRKEGSIKYASIEMPRYSEEEKKKMGIITGKLRPKPEQENKQLKNIMEQDEKVKYAAFREIKRLIEEKEITFNKHDKWCAESITLKQKLEKIEDRLKDVPMMITYEELPNVLKEILEKK